MTLSLTSSIGCVQDDFLSDGTFDTNRAPFLQCDYRCLQTDSNKLPLEARHLRVSSGASKTISDPMVCLAQTVHLYCTDTNTVSKRTEMGFHMTHSLTSSIGCGQDTYPMVHWTQTVHLSCNVITAISKRTQTSFHLRLIT
jgi:hypothetical protein